MPNKVANKRRYDLIEGLRFFLILYIASFHFTKRYIDYYPDAQFGFIIQYGGNIGNFIFMMMSGFFGAKILFNGYGIKDYGKYCINRFWRLFPAASISITIIYCILLLSPLTEERMVSFVQYLLNFTIIHPWAPYVDGSHWFIATLLQIQIIVGIVLFLKKDKSRILFLFCVLLFSAVVFILFDIPDTKIDNAIYLLTSSNWLSVYISGFIIYYTKEKMFSRWALLLPFFISVIYAVKIETWPIPLFVLLFYVAIFYSDKIKCPPILVKCGAVSFYWYLLHQNIGFCIMNELREVGCSSECILVISALFSTLLLAFIMDKVMRYIPRKII